LIFVQPLEAIGTMPDREVVLDERRRTSLAKVGRKVDARYLVEEFPDGTLNGQLYNLEFIRDRSELFLASFSNYRRMYEDYATLIVLTQCFPESVVILLPYFWSGTMERVEDQNPGQIATANIDSWMLSTLPCPGRMNRFMILDIHALQSKFYFHHTAMADLISSVPAAFDVIENFSSYSVCFPDDGAAKRFGGHFTKQGQIICGKVREGEKRIIKVKEGSPKGATVLIVDDLVQSGGTLIETMKVLYEQGAKEVSCWVTHAVFPNESYKRFLPGGDGAAVAKFYTTDSRPTMARILEAYSERFRIVPITPIVDRYL